MTKKPVVLGITAFNHDSSACLIYDGELVAFSEEERFNGVKHTNVFPKGAIEYCLSEAKIKSLDVTDVAFYFDPRKCWQAYFANNNPIAWLMDPSVFKRKRFIYEYVWLLDFTFKVRSMKRLVGNDNLTIHYVDHHNSHTWYGYYASGFKDCLVLSNDSVGEDVSTLAIHFKRNGKEVTQERLLEQKDPHSLGYLYGAVTDYLGFTRGEGEGRVMALASFGTDKHHQFFLDRTELLPNGVFKLKKSLIERRTFQPRGRRLSQLFYDTFGPARGKKDEIDQKHYDISSGVQHALEVIGFHQLDYLTQFSDNIVLVGGVAQNSVFNGLATERYPDKHFFIPPIPHDAGCSIGAAVYAYYQLTAELPKPTDTAKLGPQYSDDYVIKMLENNKIAYELLNDAADFTAKELAAGKVLAVCRGRMECGPRALCNRSILADPSKADMRDHLNHHVKYREPFRPYGGFMLPSRLDKVLVHHNKYKEGPYMTYVYEVQESWRKRIPSLVHVDNTCRIQIVEESDKFLNDLLKKFEQQTKVPILINTSLNLRGYPIARTPEDALQTFYTSAIDYMLFNGRILVRK